MKLFPRLPNVVAGNLAEELQMLPVPELQERIAFRHQSAVFTATGGTRAQESDLRDLRQALIEAAHEFADSRSWRQTQRFDAECSQILFERMGISPNEASKPGVWAFLTCLVVPDLVRRRFPGTDGTSTERFLGANRGMRNAMGRLWWRAYVLHGEGDDLPYAVLEQLGEDELVQIMERPTISGHPPLARSLAGATLNQRYHGYPGGRASLLRDAVKRVRRTAAIVPLEVLPPPVLDRQITRLVDEAYQAAGARADDAELGPWASDSSYAAFAKPQVQAPEAPPPVASDPAPRTIAPRLVLRKSLSPNDIGVTGSHQSGIVIPKSATARLPKLDAEKENPGIEVAVTDLDSGERWLCRYIYYNSGPRGTGTRDEFRITSTTGMLRALDARAGDRLLLWATGEASLLVQVVHDKLDGDAVD